MPRLIALNGPPGCGKSTIARRYAEDHPPALALDVDRVRDLIAGDLGEAGRLARDIAIAAARVHLTSGHDVIVPQFLGRPEFLDRLSALAAELDVPYYEVVLLDSEDNAIRRFTERGTVQATPAELSAMYDNLQRIITARSPHVIPSVEGDPAHTYQALLAVLNGQLGVPERSTRAT
ncbi:ATP-binding protein [Saccharothrix sp. S26]|uniref:AAA family ATPase n=1 Tax=Saccharothrix sp. S26 TaxID=2907215 RepID=UPI001F35B1AD|nr:AAA family ATPase [Saccharothrix sp. S26]MCE6996788.1 ATP-binding protein [Saccharothrix sp. S26]